MFAKLTVKVLDTCNRLSRDEEGAGLVEYGMLIGLIAIVASAGVLLVGQALNEGFSGLSTGIGTWFTGAT